MIPFQVINQITKEKVFWNCGRLFQRTSMQPQFIFRNEFYKNNTELSKELWQIKMKNYTPEKTRRIIRKCLPYNYNSRKCYLCLN